MIESTIRQAMQSNALQGFITRWDWLPRINARTYTPYEHACFGYNSSGSKNVDSAEWCQSYLRAVGNKVWLGAQLIERIGGKAALEKLPGLSYCAPYAEIDLNSDAEFDQAEAVMERILPSPADLR
jgi:hypothetical protein